MGCAAASAAGAGGGGQRTAGVSAAARVSEQVEIAPGGVSR
jgi:hypothetical protein